MGRHSRRSRTEPAGDTGSPGPDAPAATGTPAGPGAGRRGPAVATAPGAPYERPRAPRAPRPQDGPYGTPPQGTPARGTPVYGTPPRGTPAYGTPPHGTPAHGTPAHGTPVYGTPPHGVPAHGTPPHGTPRVRGGHPQQYEGGGGWGAATARPAPYATGVAPPLRPASGTVPRPRQDFVEAFDDGVFPARTPAPPARPRPGGPDGGRGPEPSAAGGEPPEDGDGVGTGGTGGGDDPDRQARHSGTGETAEKGGRGRAFTGVAAAAVTTVLAIVVAGQVADGGPNSDAAPVLGGGQRDDGAGLSRSDDRKAVEQPGGVVRKPQRLSYADRLARKDTLDPQLAGPGAFRTVGSPAEGTGKGQVVRYRVDVEKDLPLDGDLFAEAVHRTLNDERSWSRGGARTFDRVTGADADFVITLASPGTTGVWCAKSGLDTTVDNVSCDSASTPRVLINAYRWARGSKTFGDDIAGYRQMLINHEVGHRLGLNHRSCTAQGALAPVMMQQTKSLSSAGITCRPNAWPFP